LSAGLLLINKPNDWTSHDVVGRVRKIANTRRVGHAGTLDPMATGLLILGVNSATKLLTFLVGEDKTYEATIRLGADTITDDRESEFISVAEPEAVRGLTRTQIEAAIQSLTGDILQVPSSVSAIKVDGQRSYAAVRKGEEVKLAARPVTVSRFELTSEPRIVTESGNTFLDFEAVIDCSSGTYIRALARDLGRALGVGGHLTALHRTRIGGYTVVDAHQLGSLTAENLTLMPSAQAARAQFPVRPLSTQDTIDLRHGKRLKLSADERQAHAEGSLVAAIAEPENLIAMLTRSGSDFKSVVVFAEGEK
jgi:tRNA pseudouridine55 synthase